MRMRDGGKRFGFFAAIAGWRMRRDGMRGGSDTTAMPNGGRGTGGFRFVNRDWGTKQREPEFGLSNSPFSFDDFRYLCSVISVHVE